MLEKEMMVVLALLAAPLAAQEAAYTPTDAYQTDLVRGFTVLVSPAAVERKAEMAAFRAELERQLDDIRRVLPEDKLKALLPVRIWVEWEVKKNGAAEYHPSAAWLRDNGYNPEKAGGVEVSNIRNFVAWSRSTQPAMLLHELAHAYMFRFVQPGNPLHDRLKRAFDRASESGLYDDVAYVGGGTKKAYAMTDINEYFAELTEAYFLKNDFFPFVREELKAHDPDGYAVLEAIWEAPKAE